MRTKLLREIFRGANPSGRPKDDIYLFSPPRNAYITHVHTKARMTTTIINGR